MLPSIYLETTILSYLTAWRARDIVIAGKQEVTQEWWNERKKRFSIFISPYVVDEISCGDSKAAEKRLEKIKGIPVLTVDEEVARLAEAIIKEKLIPEKAATDASHIAIATKHGMDFILTWNCTHIANAEIMRMVEQVMKDNNYIMPVICTPDELMGGITYD